MPPTILWEASPTPIPQYPWASFSETRRQFRRNWPTPFVGRASDADVAPRLVRPSASQTPSAKNRVAPPAKSRLDRTIPHALLSPVPRTSLGNCRGPAALPETKRATFVPKSEDPRPRDKICRDHHRYGSTSRGPTVNRQLPAGDKTRTALNAGDTICLRLRRDVQSAR